MRLNYAGYARFLKAKNVPDSEAWGFWPDKKTMYRNGDWICVTQNQQLQFLHEQWLDSDGKPNQIPIPSICAYFEAVTFAFAVEVLGDDYFD